MIRIPMVDLRAQYESIRPRIESAMQEVMDSLAFVGNASNPFVRRFEEAFASFCGAGHAVACANGTDAIEIVLKACGIGPGDEVVVPAVTWIATSEAVSAVGASPVFADLDPQTYTLCPDSLRQALTPRTRAVIPVHLYGQCADMDAILAIASERNLVVIEDCAQAHGATYKGKTAGTLGTAGTYSFFPGKNLGAYGDAGGIVTMDADLAARCRMITQHGQSGSKFHHEIEGRNSRMDGLQAAVLSVKLEYLPAWTEARIRIADSYRTRLRDTPVRLPVHAPDRRHVYHLFAVRIPGGERQAVLERMAAEGVSCGCQYPVPLPFVKAYRHKEHRREEFPVAVELADSVLTLPLYPELTEEQVAHVAETLLQSLSSRE